MIGYASRTGTRENLALLRKHGWRLFVSAAGVWRHEGFRYAIDNGAWTYHQKGEPFNHDRFRELVCRMGRDADFVVAPDIVAGGLDSLDLSLSYLDWLRTKTRLVLIPAQDGMVPDDLRPVLSQRVGVFVGGLDEFKDETMAQWCALARECGTYSHVGRVNTQRRIRYCAIAGADSIDGTNLTKYARKNIAGIDKELRQGGLWLQQET